VRQYGGSTSRAVWQDLLRRERDGAFGWLRNGGGRSHVHNRVPEACGLCDVDVGTSI